MDAQTSHAKMIQVKPSGRSGNQIFQAIHAIAFAQAGGHRVLMRAIPPFLPALDVDFSNGRPSTLVNLNTFYLGTAEMDGFNMTLDEKARIAREFVAPRLLIRPIVSSAWALVIHLRSGDIMRPKSAHPRYTPMPLGFYDAVINDCGFREIIVVTEPDRSHPCLADLVRQYRPVVIDDLAEGDAMLLGATNLCVSISTFSGSAALCAVRLRLLFCADAELNPFRITSRTEKPTFCDIRLYRIAALEKMRWTASATQIRLLTELGRESCEAVRWADAVNDKES